MTRPGERRGPHALYLIGTSVSLIIVYSSVEIWHEMKRNVYGAAAAVVGTRSVQPSMGV